MLYLIRHGQTDYNKENILQGQIDIPLNECGRKEAIEANAKYREIPFDICFCSPLLRAKETASLLLEGRNVPIIYDNRLKEMCFGIYEGTKNLFDSSRGDISKLFNCPEEYVPVSGGESFEEIFSRIEEFLNEKVYPLLKEGKNVLIVGHGALNNSIFTIVEKTPLKDFWSRGCKNCELKKVEIKL